MKIVVLSDGHLLGGAAIAATRLARALAAAGHEVLRVVERREGEDASVAHTFGANDTRLDRLGRLLHLRPPREFRPLPETAVDFINALRPDWVSVHNLHHAGLRPGFLARLRAPVLWTLHDMWSFTGRCAYNDGCTLYRSGCDARCPTPGEYPRLPPALIAGAHAEKRALIRSAPRLRAVTPSDWMRARAIEGGWPAGRVATLRNPLDLDVFQPIDKAAAKTALGLSPTARVVGFGAMNPDDPRKGGPALVEAFAHGVARDATLLGFGSRPLPLKRDAPYVHLGEIRSERLLATVYSACDVFLHPSRQDNFPNTVCESLACGTPVVATRDSGAAEIIQDGVSGRLVADASPASLAGAIASLLDSPDARLAASAAARLRARELLDGADIALAHASLATSLIDA